MVKIVYREIVVRLGYLRPNCSLSGPQTTAPITKPMRYTEMGNGIWSSDVTPNSRAMAGIAILGRADPIVELRTRTTVRTMTVIFLDWYFHLVIWHNLKYTRNAYLGPIVRVLGIARLPLYHCLAGVTPGSGSNAVEGTQATIRHLLIITILSLLVFPLMDGVCCRMASPGCIWNNVQSSSRSPQLADECKGDSPW